MKTQPVVASELRAVRGSVIGPDTRRRVRWWELTLACGHIAERRATYRPLAAGEPRTNGWHPRPKDDVLSAPKTCRCKECR